MDALIPALHGGCQRPTALQPRRGPGSDGFTLIEILVVLAIVSVMLLAVGLSVDSGGPARRVAVEAQRLAALMQLACDESSQLGQDVGARFDTRGYAFVRAVGRDWQPRGSDALRARKLPDGMRISLRIGERDIELVPEPPAGETTSDSTPQGAIASREDAGATGLLPHLACDGDGKLSASDARITISAGDRSALLLAGEDGMLQVAGADGQVHAPDAKPLR